MTVTNGYCTQAQLFDYLTIESDSAASSLADAAINAASRSIDQWCGQFFYDSGAVSAIARHATNPTVLHTPPFHTLTGLIVKTDDGDNGTYGTTWTVTTDYVLEPPGGINTLGRTVPWERVVAVGGRWFPTSSRRPRVQVTARWGWASVPPEVYDATLIKAAALFKRKDSPSGVEGGYEFGVVRVSRYEDPTVCELLAPFRSLAGRVLM